MRVSPRHKENIMKRLISIALTLLLATTFTVAGFAAQDPSVFLKSNFEKLSVLAKNADKNQTKMEKVLDKLMDYDAICVASLGDTWETLDNTKRTDFCDTLKVVIKMRQIDRIKSALDNTTSYDSEEVVKTTSSVKTTVLAGRDKTTIVYKLHKKKGAWKAIDMVIDGESLVGRYQIQFKKLIDKKGWKGLMKALKRKAKP